MGWNVVFVVFGLACYAEGYSKYGRTCKDIGCLDSEVCVLAEDPCSFGQYKDCGTYPTCKKKSQVGGVHSRPSVPIHTTHRPSPPVNTNFGGNSPYSPYGGNPYPGGTSYGGNSYGGNSHYGGSSQYGGSSPYGGSSHIGGNLPYNSPYGGQSPFGGQSPYGSRSPFGGSSPYGGSSSYGHTRPHNYYGGNSGGHGSWSNGHSLDSIFSNFGSSSQGGSGLSSILSGILNGGTSRVSSYPSSQYGGASPYGSSQGRSNGGLSSIYSGMLNSAGGRTGQSYHNTRPVQQNPYYAPANTRSAYPSNANGNTRSVAQRPYQNYGWKVR